MAERSRDRSLSTESQPKFLECSHFRRRNYNHRCCQQCCLNDGLPLCTQDSPCLVCKDWPRLRHRGIVARPLPRRKQRRKKVRSWMIQWSYTHQETLFLPSVPSPKIRPRPNGRKQPQVPLNPRPWLPASRRWDGPASTGRTTAGRGRLNVIEDTVRKNVTSLRDISRHAVTATAATGERAGPAKFLWWCQLT